MITLGIRSSSKDIRYALVQSEKTGFKLLNASAENKLSFPAGCISISQKLGWWNDELISIIQRHKVQMLAVKVNEYNPRSRENSNMRLCAYLDSVAFLAANKTGLDALALLYSQMGTSGRTVETLAISEVGKLEKYWDSKIADAIMAAIFAIKTGEAK